MKSRFGTFVWMAALSVAFFSGCDRGSARNAALDRDDDVYRAAMADYQAGRMEAALAGFVKAAQRSPANASVRFQLACLLQDVKKDYGGAYCAYREYVLREPMSDKAKVARTRMAVCEQEFAKALFDKYRLDGVELKKTVETLQKELKDSKRRLAAAEKELQSLRERHVALSEERDRLTETVKDVDATEPTEESAVAAVTVKEARELLEEDDSRTEVDREQMSKDVASLKEDEKTETETSSTLLPTQAPDAKAKRAQLAAAREQAEKAARERELKRHPAEYVVQEGDTLYRLAERFYGRISAWKVIRDANKAVISNDGRLKMGTRLTLPYGVK